MSNRCPICHQSAGSDRAKNTFAPFCSGRCKTIDLSRWLSGDYAIPVRDEVPDEDAIAAAERNRILT